MIQAVKENVRWRAVILGWAVAIVTGIVINLLFEAAHVWLFGGNPLDLTGLTAAVVAISLVSGFLAHFAGGYVAGRRARAFGGLNGVMVAVLGFVFVVAAVVIVSAIVVATAGVVLAGGGIPLPPVTLGFVGSALLAGLALFVFNLLGGYLGGKLGEWEAGFVHSSRGAGMPPE